MKKRKRTNIEAIDRLMDLNEKANEEDEKVFRLHRRNAAALDRLRRKLKKKPRPGGRGFALHGNEPP